MVRRPLRGSIQGGQPLFRPKDGVVAIACAMHTPADPQSEIKGSLYGINGIAPGFLQDRRPWEEPSTEEGDDAGTSGGGNFNETGT